VRDNLRKPSGLASGGPIFRHIEKKVPPFFAFPLTILCN